MNQSKSIASSTPAYPLTLQNCEDEPIHIPGAIQPHGFLLAFDPVSGVIEVVSENAAAFLQKSSESLIGMSVEELLKPESAARLKRTIPALRGPERQQLALSFNAGGGGAGLQFDALAHRNAQDKAIIECEPRTETRRDSSGAPLEAFLNMLQQAGGVRQSCEAAAAHFRRLTGYDRVMVYRFDAEWNGEVIAEHADLRLESFKGLHYPSTDIPRQARELYKRQLLRIIPDLQYAPAPLLQLAPNGKPTEPLDLSHSVLRSVSPLHVEYLTNMGVRATLVISVMVGGQLWGLIACHHYSGPFYLSQELRAELESFARVLGYHLFTEKQLTKQRRRAELKQKQTEFMNGVYLENTIREGLAAHYETGLKMLGSVGAGLLLDGRCMVVGDGPSEEEANLLGRWLAANHSAEIYYSNSLSTEYQAAEAYADKASGVLALRLDRKGSEWLIWFRPERPKTVYWAGDPNKAIEEDANGYRLSPRKSFEKWKQKLSGQAEEWDSQELEAAFDLQELLENLRKAELLEIRNAELMQARRDAEHQLEVRARELRSNSNELAGHLEEVQASEKKLREALRKAERAFYEAQKVNQWIAREILSGLPAGLHTADNLVIDAESLANRLDNPNANRLLAFNDLAEALYEPVEEEATASAEQLTGQLQIFLETVAARQAADRFSLKVENHSTSNATAPNVASRFAMFCAYASLLAAQIAENLGPLALEVAVRKNALKLEIELNWQFQAFAMNQDLFQRIDALEPAGAIADESLFFAAMAEAAETAGGKFTFAPDAGKGFQTTLSFDYGEANEEPPPEMESNFSTKPARATATESPLRDAESSAGAASPLPSSGEKALLLDCYVVSAKLFRYLVADDLNVSLLHDPAELETLLRNEIFRFIFFDINTCSDDFTPEVMIKVVRSSRYNKRAYCVAVTAGEAFSERRQLLDAGFDETLEKPFTRNSVLQACGEAKR